MSRLESMFKNMSNLKANIQSSVKYDKLNKSDTIKSPSIKNIVCRGLNKYRDVINTDVDVQLEIDLDINAYLIHEGLKFESLENGSVGNLISISIIDGESLGAASVFLKKKRVTIQIEDGVTDHGTIITAIQANDFISALINISLESGNLIDVTSIMDRSLLKGGK